MVTNASNEIEHVINVIKNLEDDGSTSNKLIKIDIERIHGNNTKDFNDNYLHFVLERTVAAHDKNVNDLLTHKIKLFGIIDNEEDRRLILQIVATCQDLKITLDFNCDSVLKMCRINVN
ncbi:hypothetical protein PVAND_014860 [Polypedilum vanderplanki]|uniref:Uncharacterized protein n=1 Tax=Polypedilum vanderplanki TaxID=319348 RepID=A0A9J6BAL0_POLVA|nr:hypothetical protein PVAND_014860 [Polypedilum vanderplanki]